MYALNHGMDVVTVKDSTGNEKTETGKMLWKRAENLRLHTKLLLNNFFRIFYRIYMDNFGESVIISM